MYLFKVHFEKATVDFLMAGSAANIYNSVAGQFGVASGIIGMKFGSAYLAQRAA
jgi:hypothetical protein